MKWDVRIGLTVLAEVSICPGMNLGVGQELGIILEIIVWDDKGDIKYLTLHLLSKFSFI